MIGNRIKYYREQLGWSQEMLAHRMGYKSTSTIAKIEKSVNDVSQSNIIKFATVLGCKPSDLISIEDAPPHVQKLANDYVTLQKLNTDEIKRKELFERIIDMLSTLDENKLEIALAYLQGLVNR